MNAIGALVVLVGLIVIGTSIRGLFNRGRSIFCALAGLLVLLGAGLGGWHAWCETRSWIGTAVYAVIALIGIVSLIRQAKRCKP